jgi:DNA end-binding protein Ku
MFPHRERKADRAEGAPTRRELVDLMVALRRSIGGGPSESGRSKKPAKKPRKAAAGQKEMLMPIAGKKPAKETVAKKPSTRVRTH